MIQNLLRRFGYVPQKEIRRITALMRRSFVAAGTGRLYSSWTTTNQSGDNLLRSSLRTLRARSRELERNNSFAKKMFGMVQRNVVGNYGIRLQALTIGKDGKPDDADNRYLEQQFKKWSRKENCDVTGKNSFRDIQKMVIRHVARDGEVLIRLIRGYDNPYGFALQMLEADHLDENYNDTLPNGNQIRMGVEYNKWGKPVAYHLFVQHPGDTTYANYSASRRERIPADEILHLYIPNRASEGRGYPWIHSTMADLNMLGSYMEAELTAARVSASKMGFYKSESGDTYEGDDTDSGNPIQEVEPGILEELPPGWEFQTFDPQHPTTAFESFGKYMLRSVASGFEVSYNALANDLENVNYSSLRAGELDTRDVWRDLQRWMIEHFMVPVYEEWLKLSILSGALNLPYAKLDKFREVRFQPRGFPWVDPKSEVLSNKLAVASGFNSPQNIVGQLGHDLEEIYQQIQIAKRLREKYGITTETDMKLIELLATVDQESN